MRAVVLRDGRLNVRDIADPVPGPGELLLRTLSTAICASDVHFMDHPEMGVDDPTGRSLYDPDRDIVLGHEFVGEVIGHGYPDAQGSFGELVVVAEALAKPVEGDAPSDAVALTDAFAVGEFYVRSARIEPGEIPLVIGAGAVGLSAIVALASRGVEPIVVSDYKAERRDLALSSFGAHIAVDPAETSPFDVWRELRAERGLWGPLVIFECVGAAGLIQQLVQSADMGTRIYCAGGWYTGDSLSITDATRQGVTIQFGGGPHPQDWYGTLDAIASGRLDPLPSVGSVVSLDEVPDALDLARKSDGPPRIVVHPNGDLK